MQIVKADTGKIAGRAEEQELALLDEKFHFTPTGLVVKGDPTFEEWEEVGQLLGHIQKRIHFWIGDWLNYGEWRWGETYAQAIDETGFSYHTLAHDKYIAGKVEFCRRRQNLSFSHHAEVASLPPPEQEKWLEKAESEGLSIARLRKEIQKAKKEQDNPGNAGAVEINVRATFVVQADHAEKLKDATKKWGADLALLPGVECKSFDVSEAGR